MSKVCILGSINMDMVYKVDSIPKEGETIEAEALSLNAGGKGLNQAVAVSRLGEEVFFIGRVGIDEYENDLAKVLMDEKVDITYLNSSKESSTGRAVIMIDKNGKNCITVLGGANMTLTKEDILSATDEIIRAKIMVAQFEVPMEAILEGFKVAKKGKATTILNPAPAKTIPEELYTLTDIIIPNETELEKISNKRVTSVKEAIEASKVIIGKGVKVVIATLGEAGAVAVTEKEEIHVKGERVKAIDTTAAGDSFIGALVYKLAKENYSLEDRLEEVITFANKAAAITVQRKGAQPSLPYLYEVK